MLGFLCICEPWPSTSFVSATSFRPSPARLDYHKTVDARHGRVLLHGPSFYRKRELQDHDFAVWDPIAGGEPTRLPSLQQSVIWNAAVLCASAAAQACDHLDCHSGPFLVVFVGSGWRGGSWGMWARVYSSEAAAWSRGIYAPHLDEELRVVPSALAGNSLCFLCHKSVLKFDLATRKLSLIDGPQGIENFGRPIIRETEDGGLGLASLCRGGLHLWSMEVGPDEDVDVGWTQCNVIKPVIPDELARMTGFAQGLDVILVGTSNWIFTVDLKSLRVTKVCEGNWLQGFTFPYMSFYTPGHALQADPKNGAGKILRKALPKPALQRISSKLVCSCMRCHFPLDK